MKLNCTAKQSGSKLQRCEPFKAQLVALPPLLSVLGSQVIFIYGFGFLVLVLLLCITVVISLSSASSGLRNINAPIHIVITTL
jgi:hypothetical protein